MSSIPSAIRESLDEQHTPESDSDDGAKHEKTHGKDQSG